MAALAGVYRLRLSMSLCLHYRQLLVYPKSCYLPNLARRLGAPRKTSQPPSSTLSCPGPLSRDPRPVSGLSILGLLSSHLFVCLPLAPCPQTVPRRVCLDKPALLTLLHAPSALVCLCPHWSRADQKAMCRLAGNVYLRRYTRTPTQKLSYQVLSADRHKNGEGCLLLAACSDAGALQEGKGVEGIPVQIARPCRFA